MPKKKLMEDKNADKSSKFEYQDNRHRNRIQKIVTNDKSSISNYHFAKQISTGKKNPFFKTQSGEKE